MAAAERTTVAASDELLFPLLLVPVERLLHHEVDRLLYHEVETLLHQDEESPYLLHE